MKHFEVLIVGEIHCGGDTLWGDTLWGRYIIGEIHCGEILCWGVTLWGRYIGRSTAKNHNAILNRSDEGRHPVSHVWWSWVWGQPYMCWRPVTVLYKSPGEWAEVTGSKLGIKTPLSCPSGGLVLWPEEKKYCGWCVCVFTWYLDAKEFDWHYLTCRHLLFAHQVGYPFSILPFHIWEPILCGRYYSGVTKMN